MIALLALLGVGSVVYCLVFLYLTRHFKRSPIPGVGIVYPGKIASDEESKKF